MNQRKANARRPAMPSKAKPAAASVVAKREAPSGPSPSEAKAIAEAIERAAARRARIAVSAKSDNGVLGIGSPHSDDVGFAVRLLDTFGTESSAFCDQALGRLGAIMRRKGSALPTQSELNAALAAVDGVRPADEIEAMLALQMVATHETAMEMLTRAKQAEFMPTLQECGSLAVKLLRTYTAQVEALARLRRGGEQKVVVHHVHVSDGGQAIVGAVNHPGGSEK